MSELLNGDADVDLVWPQDSRMAKERSPTRYLGAKLAPYQWLVAPRPLSQARTGLTGRLHMQKSLITKASAASKQSLDSPERSVLAREVLDPKRPTSADEIIFTLAVS